MARWRRLRCSFCRKSETDVTKLVAGPNVYICDACVAEASRIMEQHGDAEPRPQSPRPNVLHRWWMRVGPKPPRAFRSARTA